MRICVYAVLIWATVSLVACRGDESARLSGRISALEDSLKVYRDSLRAAQTVWSFNSLTAVVKLQKNELQLGDSCRAEVIIGAANSSDSKRLGYRFGEAHLAVEGIPEAKITKTETRWIVAFKPDSVGEDSLTGNITIDGTFGGPTELSFGSWYKVAK